MSGSSVTGTVNVDTSSIGTTGTLGIDAFTGDVSGSAFDSPGTYDMSWTGAVNTIDITQEAVGPASADAGDTAVVMGRFGIEQTNIGADYFDSDLDQIKLFLTGSGNAGDVTEIRLYYDADCDSAGGVEIGTGGTFSGNPPSRNFNMNVDVDNSQKENCASSTADVCIEADDVTTTMECLYVEYDFAIGQVLYKINFKFLFPEISISNLNPSVF